MAETGATVNLRGAGGVEFTFDLPLAPAIQDQFDRGHLQPVGPGGEVVTHPPPADTAAVDRPDEIAGVSQWRAYAIAQGIDPAEAKAMKKPDLIARFPLDGEDVPDAAVDDEDSPAS